MIAAGFGFRGSADTDSLRAALAACGAAPDLIATAMGKEKSAGLRRLAEELGVPIHAVPLGLLEAQKTYTYSPASHAAHGTGSVAEAAALAAAGPGARLISARQISPDRMATCAMAEGDGP
ncbi:cobalt-precorrin 5A hydrolase [Roseovarius nanhaiticus]|uniref:Cobalt-precorrin 5A hydrolase n=1 Tax=Roseovarius nanhaiticus TaxID=573024 RepID=A0A1N7HNK3_9RHOB|nr:cobalamin biosynthesis protein [Roseovarius nanhaiticus]SEL37835.1 cobalt-precorrin 5A hydrolase [Roseovarius nanhaiticus]SIS26393.1 cobalt-precorrin 5A hydrolase [Roseovarius nanhaiticus]